MKILRVALVVFVVLFSTTIASAQFYNKKKVVITEVVDKAGNVAEGTKVYIRSALTDAITNSEGYAGFCDVSIVSIEYNFLRTGTLSKESLLVIYQRYAAEYVLVSELNALDSESVLLTARIINTNTGEIINSAMQRVMADLDMLPAACNQLVGKLLRKKRASADASQSTTPAATSFFSSRASALESPHPSTAATVNIYKVGDYVEIEGVGGVVFVVWNGGKNGKMVSIAEQLSDWPTADKQCQSLGKDWRLPTKEELLAIYKNKVLINNTLTAMVEKRFENFSYWSSSNMHDNSRMCAPNERWRVYMSDGFVENDLMIHKNFVRAVRTF